MIFLVILFTNQQWLGAFLLTIGPDEDPIQNMEQLWLRIHNQKTWDVASKPICTDDFLMKFWMMIWIRKWEGYTPSYSGCSGILWQAQHAHHHLRRMVWKHMLFFLIHESVGKEFVWSPRGHVSCWSSHKLDVDTYIIKLVIISYVIIYRKCRHASVYASTNDTQ